MSSRKGSPSRPTSPGRPVSSARRVALEVLRAVQVDDAYANLVLPSRIAAARLSPADAAFATELTYGALRRRGLYDAVIALAAARPLERIDPGVLDVLRLGVHQLLGMRVPAHAAVDESVAQTIAGGHRSASGFVNGVLRTIAREAPAVWLERITAGLEGDARLAVEHAHPPWIVTAFRAALAAESAETELADLLLADNTPPVVSLVALPGLADPATAGQRGALSPIATRSPGGDPAGQPLVAAGSVRVQDEGSQLAALALSRARPIVTGERWLDLCAGPGGKAAVLAAEARTGGATLVANEIVPARAGLVRSALAVFPDPPEVLERDGRRIGDEFPGVFDRILLDAPCTGLGALRRRPEARWRKGPGDVPGLVALQAELLDSAVAALAPGGLLAYVTCSPLLAETRAQVEGVIARHPGLTALDTPRVLAGVATADLQLPVATSVQLWPHRNGTDAMFVQLLAAPA